MERSKIVRRFLKDAMPQRLSGAYLPSQLSDAPPRASFLIAYSRLTVEVPLNAQGTVAGLIKHVEWREEDNVM